MYCAVPPQSLVKYMFAAPLWPLFEQINKIFQILIKKLMAQVLTKDSIDIIKIKIIGRIFQC